MSDFKGMRKEYLTEWRHCQYAQALGRHVDPFSQYRIPRPRQFPIPAQEVEHIWNRHGAASEHPSNYASTCRAFHLWKHENSVEARIAIMHFKWKLSVREDRIELFDRVTLRNIAGRDVIGWVEYKQATTELPAWCDKMAIELVTAFDE